MFQDLNMERYPAQVGTGTDIAPMVPTEFKPELFPDGLAIYISGANYAGAVAKIVRPLLSQSTGQLSLTLEITPDEGVQNYCQAIEFDLRVTTPDGWTYFFDMQIDVNAGGQFQIATGIAAGKIAWTPAGIVFGALPAGKPATIALQMAYSASAHTSSVLSATCNGVGGNVPLALQNQPAAQIGWQPSTVVRQLQLDTTLAGGAFSVKFANDNLGYVGS